MFSYYKDLASSKGNEYKLEGLASLDFWPSAPSSLTTICERVAAGLKKGSSVQTTACRFYEFRRTSELLLKIGKVLLPWLFSVNTLLEYISSLFYLFKVCFWNQHFIHYPSENYIFMRKRQRDSPGHHCQLCILGFYDVISVTINSHLKLFIKFLRKAELSSSIKHYGTHITLWRPSSSLYSTYKAKLKPLVCFFTCM